MSALMLAGTQVRQDAAGRYHLNDLHRAAGGENRHRPSLWIANRQTAALLSALNSEAGIPALAVEHGGASPGTFAARELVYAYAMWIRPQFHLQVIRAYDSLHTAAPRIDPSALTRRDLLQLALQAEEELSQARAIVAELEPKAAALDRIATAAGSLCVTDTAKQLSMPPSGLFTWLRANGWIYRRFGSSAWVGYGQREQAGQIEHKITTLQRTGPSGEPIDRIATQVRITPKGLAALAIQIPDSRRRNAPQPSQQVAA